MHIKDRIRILRRAALPVLLYHHVGPPQLGPYSLLPEQFEQQMDALSRWGYSGICPSDWLAWLREDKPLPARPVLITFDDGYADIVQYALPCVRRFGFKAAVFVVTGRMGGTNTWDARYGWKTLRLMSHEQIREWATQGIEFGAHSRTHPDLSKLTRLELMDEVRGSGEDLSTVLGTRVVSFAYPYGLYSQAALECAKDSFDLCFTTQAGLNKRSADPHLLRRISVYPDESLALLRCKIDWAWAIPGVAHVIPIRVRRVMRGAINALSD